jgi:ketosteroid isomerase-like protein
MFNHSGTPEEVTCMTEHETRIEELTRRLQALEDEWAIRNALISYGWAVDSNDPDATASLYAEECVIEVNGNKAFHGREGVRNLVRSDTHQSLLPNCAHLTGPLAIQVDGDRACATGYLAVVLRTGTKYEIWRQGCGRWELERRGAEWLVVRRISVPVGSAEAQALLSQGLADLVRRPAT